MKNFKKGDQVTYIGPDTATLINPTDGEVIEDQTNQYVRCDFDGNRVSVHENDLVKQS